MRMKKIVTLVSAVALMITNITVISLPAAYAEEENGFFEDFEGYEETGEAYSLVDTMNDLYEGGWSVAGDNAFTAREEADDSQKFARIVKDGDNKVLELSTTEARGRMLDPLTETPSGSYEISFKFKPEEQMKFDFSANSFNEMADIAKHNILYSDNGMRMGHRMNSINVPMTRVGTAENVWYEVKCVVNNDSDYYSAELYKEGVFVARRGAINYAGDEKIGFLKLSGFGATIYIDDVSIKPCEQETLIYEDNFDSYSEVKLPTSYLTVGANVSEAQSREGESFFEGYSPWRALKTFGNNYDLVYDSTLESQVVRLGDDKTTSVQESTGMILMPLEGEYLTKESQTKRGRLKLTYKFKHYSQSGYASAIDLLSDYRYSGKWDYPPQVAIQEKGLPRPAVSGLPYLRTNDTPIKINQEMWYDAEVIFDVINDEVTVIVREDSAGTEIAHFTHHTNWINPASAPVFDKVKAINFRAVNGSSIYVDDVRLEYYITKPEISGNSIIITDFRGEKVTDKNNVPAAIKSIELPFGCEMTEESTNPDNVILADSKGGYLNYSPVYDSGSYILIPDGFLTPGETYTLTVPGTVTNTFGRELGTDFEYSFTVAPDYPELMAISSVSVTDLSDIVNGSIIDVETEYVNSTDSPLKSLIFTAYYGDNMLLALSSEKPDAIGAGEMGTKTISIGVPGSGKLDLNKVDRVIIGLWKGFKDSAAYSDAVEIKAGSETPSAALEAVSGDVLNPSVTYSYSESVLNISGTANEDSKYLTVHILKPGNTFEAGDEQTAEASDNLVFYRTQIPVEKAGYSLDVRFDVKGNTESQLEAGFYPTAIYLDDTKLNTESVYICSYSDFQDTLSDLNAAAESNDFTEFKNILNNKRSALNFDSALLGDTVLGDEIKPYFEYIKENPLSAENEKKNLEMFNTYVVIQYLNDSKIENINANISELLIADDVKALCDKILTTDEKGKYFTDLISGKDIENPEQLEKSINEALILTAAKHGNGYGELKNVLEICGSEIGISKPISDSACRALMGKTYKDGRSFKSAYDKAAETSESSSSGSTGGGKKSSLSSVQVPASDAGSENLKVTPIKRVFNDIDNYEWAMTAILALADRNIINGVSEDRFEPSKDVTREQFIKMLMAALGVSDYVYGGNVFIDASDDDWFVRHINVAADLGIVKGIGNGMFGVGYPITRQDMAVMIYKALQYRNVNMKIGEFKFDDDGQIADYAKDAVAALHDMGAINGVTKTTFEPTSHATRAQAAKIIYSVLQELQG